MAESKRIREELIMSYCRRSEGADAYLYGGDDGFTCSYCKLRTETTGDPDVHLPDRRAALAHLNEHIAAGHNIPDSAIDRLTLEIAVGKSIWRM